MRELTFSQWRAFVRITATLEDDGVRFRERGPLGGYEAKILFHQIPDEPVRFFAVPRSWVFGTMVLAFVFFQFIRRYLTSETPLSAEPMIWSGLFLLMAALNVWGKSGRIVGYPCGARPMFFFDLPGDRSPLWFMSKIQEAKREYFTGLFAEERETTPASDTPVLPNRTTTEWTQ